MSAVAEGDQENIEGRLAGDDGKLLEVMYKTSSRQSARQKLDLLIRNVMVADIYQLQ
jgi:hypothetical protein